MFDVKMTINGKPATEANIKNESEQAVMKVLVANVKERIKSAITPIEAQQITINIAVTSFGKLSVNVNGPQDILNKVQTAMNS